MAGPGGHEVERISVKVVPDTDGFHEKVKAFLEKEEKRLSLKINLELNKGTVEAELKKLEKDLHVKLKAELDDKLAKSQIKNLTKNQRVKVTASLNATAARAKLKALTRPRTVSIRANVNKSQTRKVAGLFAGITKAAEKDIQGIFSRITGSISSAFGQVSGGLGKVTNGLGKLGAIAQGLQVVLIGSIVPAIIGLIIAAGGLAGALALALSPALFIGAGIAFDILAQKGKKTSSKLKKAFSSVAKTAKSVITEAIQPMVTAIAAELPNIDAFIEKLRGPLHAAFAAASGFVDEFSRGIQQFINGTLSGLVAALQNPGMQQAVSGMEILLGRLGFALGFFFQELAKSGSAFRDTLVAIGDSMVSLLPALARMLGAFASVSPQIINGLTAALESIFKTLSDPKVLQPLANLSVHSFGAIAAGVSGIAKVVALASDGWDKLKDKAESTWNRLKGSSNSVVVAIKDVWNKIVQAVTQAFNKVKAVIVSDLIPAIKAFIPAIEPVVAFLIHFFGDILVGIIKDVGTVLAGAIKVISGILNILTGILTGDWSKVWEGLKQIVSGVLSSIFAVIRLFLLSKIGAVFKIFGKLLGPLWRLIWKPLADFLETILIRIFVFVDDKFTAIKGVVTRVGGAIRSVVSSVWSAIASRVASAVGRVKSVVTGAWNAIKSVTSAIWHGIASVIAGVWHFIESIVSKIAGAVNRVKGFVNFLNPFNAAPPPSDPKKPSGPLPRKGPRALDVAPRPVKGVWDSIGSMQDISSSIGKTARKFAMNTTPALSKAEAASASKVYNVTINDAKDEPTEDKVVRSLRRLDILYSH